MFRDYPSGFNDKGMGVPLVRQLERICPFVFRRSCQDGVKVQSVITPKLLVKFIGSVSEGE